jgi:hypothetical protein
LSVSQCCCEPSEIPDTWRRIAQVTRRTSKGGALQVTIDHQGRVVTESGPIDASVDLGSFGASLAGTRMNIHEVVDGHFHDYGSAVTVTRPAAAAVTAS